jgi:hypothetical protein
METLLAGFFLDRSRSSRRKPRQARQPSGLRRLVVAVAVIAVGFAMLDYVAETAPSAGLSVAASCYPQQGEPKCNMSAWSMARKAASMP